MKEIRFIHTADLHLDSPFAGMGHLPQALFERMKESTFVAWRNLTDFAIKEAVDFLIVTGDLYDGEDRSIKAQARIRNELERLKEAGIPVFISHGNHDHLAGEWLQLEMPDNTYVFPGHVDKIPLETAGGTTVHIYGFSYPQRHVYSRMAEEYKKAGNADFHIAMLHGNEESEGNGHHPYAPFSVKELLSKKMDYWALGHVHQSKILHRDPPVIYPGNIQGRHSKEIGPKGCFLVTLSKQGNTDLQMLETADIRWERTEINLNGETKLSDLYSICMESLAQLHKGKIGVLCDIFIRGTEHLPGEVKQKIENGELIEMLQENNSFEEEFVWPYRLRIQEERLSGNFDKALIRQLDETVAELWEDNALEGILSPLFSHTYASRYLHDPDEREKREIVDEGRQILVRHFLNAK